MRIRNLISTCQRTCCNLPGRFWLCNQLMTNSDAEIFRTFVILYSSFKPGDCFVGYHSDTAAAVVIQISSINNGWSDEQVYTILTA